MYQNCSLSGSYVFQILFPSLYFSISEDHWIGSTGPVDCDLCPTSVQNCDACRALWSWMDGTAMTDANGDLIYSNWKSTEPNSDTGCMRIDYYTGQWRDQTCTTAEPFICKKGWWSALFDGLVAPACLL